MIQHIETKYGKGFIARELATLSRYIVITMDIPWDLSRHLFQVNPPEQVVMVDSLDQEKLDEMSLSLPAKVEIVGLGGGTAIDAAKYLAYLNHINPILIPTITSTNAPFSDFMSIRKNGGPFGFKVDGYEKKVWIDSELIQRSDPRFNRAGYGDLLYMQTTLNDWKIVEQQMGVTQVEPRVEHQINELVDEAIQKAVEIGDVTEQGIYALMENTEQTTLLYMLNPDTPISAGSEHLFAWNLELITRRHFVHGEIVALGIVICSFLQEKFVHESKHIELRRALDEAQVIYQPEILGISWKEIEQTLLTAKDYNQRVRGFHTVFDHIEWTPELLAQIKEYINA